MVYPVNRLAGISKNKRKYKVRLESLCAADSTSQALDFTMNRVLIKLFNISNIETYRRMYRHFSRRTVISAASETFSQIFVTVVIWPVYILLNYYYVLLRQNGSNTHT